MRAAGRQRHACFHGDEVACPLSLSGRRTETPALERFMSRPGSTAVTRANCLEIIFSIALGAGAIAAPCVASASGEGRFLECAQEQDDARRLSCYDRVAASSRRSSKAQPVVPPRVVGEDEAGKGEAQASGRDSVSASTAKPASTVLKPAEDVSSMQEFGLSGSELARRRGAQENASEGQEEPDRLDAAVAALSSRPRGERIVTLDNGQVWVQKTPQYISIKVGDQVTIRKGALRSYRLVAGGRSTAVTRIE